MSNLCQECNKLAQFVCRDCGVQYCSKTCSSSSLIGVKIWPYALREGKLEILEQEFDKIKRNSNVYIAIEFRDWIKEALSKRDLSYTVREKLKELETKTTEFIKNFKKENPEIKIY